MPYINRFPTKKTRWQNSNKRKRNRTDKEKLRVKLYNNSKWKKLRLQTYTILTALLKMG